MLGITLTDAVAVTTILLGLAAFWRGAKGGELARRHSPPESTVSIGSTVFADTAAMTQQTAVLTRIAEAIESQNKAYQEREKDRVAHALERLVKRLDTRDHDT